MEAADRFGEALLDRHAGGVAIDQLGGLSVAVVGEDQGGVLVAEAAHRDLAQRNGAAAHLDLGLVDLGVGVAAFAVERDRGPLGIGA